MKKRVSTLTGCIVLSITALAFYGMVLVINDQTDSFSQISPPHSPSRQALAAETNTPGIVLTSSTDTVTNGKEFSVEVRTNSSQPINAVTALVSYPTDQLTLVSVSDAGSAFDVNVPQTNSAGLVTMTKGSLTPVTGNQLVGTLLFKAKAVGTAPLTVTTDSKLVNSSTNTNILFQFGTEIITIVSVASTPTLTNTPTPVPTGFKGEYYNNKNLSGSPIMTRFDNSINFNWGRRSPASNIDSDTYSVRWTKSENFAGGVYKFTVKNDDGMRIFIDGRRVYNKWNDQSARTRTFTVPITAGTHQIKVEYYENKGNAVAQVNWKLK